jgi:probable phosphoglycerate mutase
MVQVVLIRPGTTDYDEQGRIVGNLDIPLNAQGFREVERIIQEIRQLEISAVYCGPCEAVCQTAEAISEALGAKLKKIDQLRNIDHGLWQGLLVDDVKQKQPKVYRQWREQPEIICPPEGEMLAEARERVQSALVKIMKKHKDGAIAVVLSEPMASVVQALISQCQLGDLWRGGSVCGKWDVLSVEAPSLANPQT